jgi:hypothetical protein
MIPLAVAGSVAVVVFIAAWVLVAYFKTRLTSIKARVVRFVVGRPGGWATRCSRRSMATAPCRSLPHDRRGRGARHGYRDETGRQTAGDAGRK